MIANHLYKLWFMKKNLSVSAICTFIMLLVMRWQGAALIATTSKKGIVDLEFASTKERLHEVLLHWDLSVVKMNIWLDFLFIVCYVLFLSIASEACAEKWPVKTMPAQIGIIFARLAYAAGVFDIAENLLMLQSVGGNYTDASLQLTFYCASIKFLIIGLIIIYLIASLPFIIRKK